MSDNNQSFFQQKEFERDKVFEGIFPRSLDLDGLLRRLTNSRSIPVQLQKMMNVKHIRGVLIQGSDKALKFPLAKYLALRLSPDHSSSYDCRNFQSESEGSDKSPADILRGVFAAAQSDYRENREDASLHVIILNNLECIGQRRSESKCDWCVSQLLSLIDGVDSSPNFVVIGVTTDATLIDPALLRPNRLEIHVEVPDK